LHDYLAGAGTISGGVSGVRRVYTAVAQSDIQLSAIELRSDVN
jgi:hypothetical protein